MFIDDRCYSTNKKYHQWKAQAQLQDMLKQVDDTSKKLVKEGETFKDQVKILQELTGLSHIAAEDLCIEINKEINYNN